MLRRWLLSTIVVGVVIAAGLASAGSYPWPTHNDSPGPGGLATITLEYPKHGSHVKGPDLDIRLHSDNLNAALLVKLDGKYIDINGLPHVRLTTNPYDYPQWSFREGSGKLLLIPARGLAPGLHTLEILEGTHGTELPDTNEQKITFIVD